MRIVAAKTKDVKRKDIALCRTPVTRDVEYLVGQFWAAVPVVMPLCFLLTPRLNAGCLFFIPSDKVFILM